MKRFLTLILCCISLFIYGNESFDPSKNYQGQNASSYVGEILIVRAFPKDFSSPEFYRDFKDFSFDENWDSNNNMQLNYHFNVHDDRDCCVSGTHPRWLTGKSFKVDKVYQLRDYEHTFVFEMHNINNTSDRVKYIYHDSYKFLKCFYEFPFIVKKHLDHVKKTLTGNKVVIGTVSQNFFIYEHSYFHLAYCRYDINTGETISYNKPYETFTVKNVEIDKETQEISLILSYGSHTVKEIYHQFYEENPIAYNSGVRIFTESQWESLVSKHGLSVMNAVMSGKIIPGMTMTEAFMSRGRYVSLDTSSKDFNCAKWSSNLYFNVDKKNNKIVSARTKKSKNFFEELFGL